MIEISSKILRMIAVMKSFYAIAPNQDHLTFAYAPKNYDLSASGPTKRMAVYACFRVDGHRGEAGE